MFKIHYGIIVLTEHTYYSFNKRFEMQLLDPVHCGEKEEEEEQQEQQYEGGGVYVVSTAPGRPYNSWDQALVFSAKEEEEEEEDTCLHLRCSIQEDRILLDVVPTVAAALTPSPPQGISQQDSPATSMACGAGVIRVPVGEMDFAALNDFHVTEAYMTTLHRYLTERRRHCWPQSPSPIRILELTSTWRSYALLYKHAFSLQAPSCVTPAPVATGSGTGTGTGGVHALVVCVSTQHKAYLEACAHSLEERIGCQGRGDVHVMSGSLVEACAAVTSSTQHEHQHQHQQQQQGCPHVAPPEGLRCTFDLLLCDLLEGSGMLKQGVLADLTYALHCLMRHQPPSPPPPLPLAGAQCPGPGQGGQRQGHGQGIELSSPRDLSSLQQRVMPFCLGIMLCLVESHALCSQFRIDPRRTVQVNEASFQLRTVALSLQSCPPTWSLGS